MPRPPKISKSSTIPKASASAPYWQTPCVCGFQAKSAAEWQHHGIVYQGCGKGSAPLQHETMKDIESQAIEYAEALNDIADALDIPTGAKSAEIVQAARNRWATGIHTCHDKCSRERCVERRKMRLMREALEYIADSGLSARHLSDHARAILDLENVKGQTTANEKP
jgi:hypothetical protein